MMYLETYSIQTTLRIVRYFHAIRFAETIISYVLVFKLTAFKLYFASRRQMSNTNCPQISFLPDIHFGNIYFVHKMVML